ncbi:hypothetical protein HFO06_28790 [Rhizobium leguminosarum]|uniref:hypothetical protein n=1 Tax=Rhizobium leguminosarum TaxID=384 RepID=UPI001C951AFC|nr:hypothetical protein [Rhizobium leguminosarum]MBY5767047.1 hypothetical protein [Rhizobium leguminosarum]
MAKVERLREALKFYADEKKQKPVLTCEWDSDGVEHFITKKHVAPHHKDAGFKARHTLIRPLEEVSS